ncbi:hypothetical protein AAFF_G00322640 [Aldrovandia affinis]|uniref:Uncharacterized protein n=1 Tax=Aldrovandia affinis TaxID=143900 RepID=A0AAD7SN48_9TELE|nr:hypothetical protein AAFF_G00322640 [Aldrovandia affinis]
MSDEGEESDTAEQERGLADDPGASSPSLSHEAAEAHLSQRQGGCACSPQERRGSAPLPREHLSRAAEPRGEDASRAQPPNLTQSFMEAGTLFRQRQNARLAATGGKHAILPENRGHPSAGIIALEDNSSPFQDRGQRFPLDQDYDNHSSDCLDSPNCASQQT